MPLTPILLLAALSCSPKASPGTRRPEPGPPTPPAITHPAAKDDTGTEVPFNPIATRLDPAVTIYGEPGMGIWERLGVLEAENGGPGLLFVMNGASFEGGLYAHLPATLVIPGVQPPGEHVITDLWDGVSGFELDGTYLSAGDVNDDGHLDVWGPNRLYHGPFLGRLHTLDDAVAWIDEPESYAYEGEVVVADFDADGDGHEDVMFVPCCQMGVVRYGPFSGPILPHSSYGFDPSDTSTLGSMGGCDASELHVNLLRDHLGPGHHAVSFASYYECWPDTLVYDLQHPPGTQVPPSSAIAKNEGGYPLKDVGDLDGDGFHDVVTASTWAFGHYLYKGPVSGWVYDLPQPVSLREEITDLSYVREAVGDLDGDGVTELLVNYYDPSDPRDIELVHWILLFSPYDEPDPIPRGVELGPYADLKLNRWSVVDLDGDGLNDLVHAGISDSNEIPPPPPEILNAGELRIWYGKDLLSAYEAAVPAR